MPRFANHVPWQSAGPLGRAGIVRSARRAGAGFHSRPVHVPRGQFGRTIRWRAFLKHACLSRPPDTLASAGTRTATESLAERYEKLCCTFSAKLSPTWNARCNARSATHDRFGLTTCEFSPRATHGFSAQRGPFRRFQQAGRATNPQCRTCTDEVALVCPHRSVIAT